MTTQAPSYPLSRLTTGTDRGVTNAVDAVYVLEHLYKQRTQPVTSKSGRVGYLFREDPEALSSKNANDNQALIGRLDDGHRIHFVVTVTPRKGVPQAKSLKSLHVYYNFPVLGTVRVRTTSDLEDNNGDKKITFSFGPYLDGSAIVKFPQDKQQTANVTFKYTANGKEVKETSVDVDLQKLDLRPFAG